jgi:hypothetical protein
VAGTLDAGCLVAEHTGEGPGQHLFAAAAALNPALIDDGEDLRFLIFDAS